MRAESQIRSDFASAMRAEGQVLEGKRGVPYLNTRNTIVIHENISRHP